MSSAAEASAAMKLSEADVALPCPISSDHVGLARWSFQYVRQRPTMTSLEGVAVSVVDSYDHQKYKEKMKEKKLGQPDEDGWITVTRKRRSVYSQVSCRCLVECVDS